MVQKRRLDILQEGTCLKGFLDKCPEKFNKIKNLFGEAAAMEGGRKVLLYHIDKAWAEHLAFSAHIREGIHLVSLTGKRPIEEYHYALIPAFCEFWNKVETASIADFERILLTKTGFCPADSGLKSPSSSWTYLVNDQLFDPARNFMQNIFKKRSQSLWKSIFQG